MMAQYVKVYDQTGFAGNTSDFPPSRFNRLDAFPRGPVNFQGVPDNSWGNEIASIRLPPHWVVYLHRESDFKDGPSILWADRLPARTDGLPGGELAALDPAYINNTMSMEIADPLQPMFSRENVIAQGPGSGSLADTYRKLQITGMPTELELAQRSVVIYQKTDYRGEYMRLEQGSHTAPWSVESYGVPSGCSINDKTDSNDNDYLGTSLTVRVAAPVGPPARSPPAALYAVGGRFYAQLRDGSWWHVTQSQGLPGPPGSPANPVVLPSKGNAHL